MASLMKQLRVRFSGTGEEDQADSQNIRVPSQKSVSARRGEMSEYDKAYAAAVAAAAYAITAQEEDRKKPISSEKPGPVPLTKAESKKDEITKKPSGVGKISRWFSSKDLGEDDGPVDISVRRPLRPAQKKPDDTTAEDRKKRISSETATPAPLTKAESKKEESTRKSSGVGKISRWFSSKDLGEDDGPVNISVRRPLRPAQKKPDDTTVDQRVTQKTDAAPSMKRAPTFSSKSRDEKGSRKFEQNQTMQKPSPATRPASAYSARENGATTQPSVVGIGETKADEWEKAKLAKIREEYNKMMKTIAEWETEKKVKAKLQKEQKERELDRKRAKALEEYNNEMSRIDKIVGGARAMAEDRRRNDETKVMEKAKKIRSTGKLPGKCDCF